MGPNLSKNWGVYFLGTTGIIPSVCHPSPTHPSPPVSPSYHPPCIPTYPNPLIPITRPRRHPSCHDAHQHDRIRKSDRQDEFGGSGLLKQNVPTRRSGGRTASNTWRNPSPPLGSSSNGSWRDSMRLCVFRVGFHEAPFFAFSGWVSSVGGTFRFSCFPGGFPQWGWGEHSVFRVFRVGFLSGGNIPFFAFSGWVGR